MNPLFFYTFIAIGIVVVAIILYFYNIQMVLGELTTGDIAQFTPEQERTYQNIGTDIILLDSELKGTQNNSTLSNDEIQNQIMEYFIVNQLTYCVSWNEQWSYCNIPMNSSHITRGHYLKLVQENQPSPFDGLFKLFGGFIIPNVYGSGPELDYDEDLYKNAFSIIGGECKLPEELYT